MTVISKTQETIKGLFHPQIAHLLAALAETKQPLRIKGAHGAFKALLLALVARYTQKPIIFIVTSEKEAKALAGDIAFFGERARHYLSSLGNRVGRHVFFPAGAGT